MRIVLISDTHGMHDLVDVPEGDVLLHSGDYSRKGNRNCFLQFLSWLELQPHDHKVFIPGNHDRYAQSQTKGSLKLVAGHKSIHMLLDDSISIRGTVFYGSPWCPKFGNWYFMENRGEAMKRIWSKIPEDTDVLLTHGPPYGHGDLAPPYISRYPRVVGCIDLLSRVRVVRPRVHVFGHIHGGYGITRSDDDALINTMFVNASTCTESYAPTNAPIVLDI